MTQRMVMDGVPFIRTPWFWFVACVGGMSATAVAAYSPESFPEFMSFVPNAADAYPALWPSIWYAALAAHILEAVYITYKAMIHGCTIRDTMLWGIQTTLLGFPSTTRFLKSLAKKQKARDQQ